VKPICLMISDSPVYCVLIAGDYGILNLSLLLLLLYVL